MRILYFDIDGTVLRLSSGVVKPCLAGGALESAIRERRFDHVVCVGNVLTSLRMAAELGVDVDEHESIFGLCGDAFGDEAWFRDAVSFVQDPAHRAAAIELGSDWWYMDDLAEHYFEVNGTPERFGAERGRRVLVPEPDGDGADVMAWLGRIDA